MLELEAQTGFQALPEFFMKEKPLLSPKSCPMLNQIIKRKGPESSPLEREMLTLVYRNR